MMFLFLLPNLHVIRELDCFLMLGLSLLYLFDSLSKNSISLWILPRMMELALRI